MNIDFRGAKTSPERLSAEKGNMMKRKLLCLFALVPTAVFTQNAAAVLMEFSDLPLNHVYNVGSSFTTSGIQVQVQQFYPVIGLPLSGTAVVDDSMTAGGWGKELTLNNADLKFLLDFNGYPAGGIALLFSELSGDVNLGINDDVRRAADFTGMPSNIGGAQVSVSGYPLGAILTITGDIRSLTIGGQELSIDSVLACESKEIGGKVPEPTTIVLLGLGSLGVLMGRKK